MCPESWQDQYNLTQDLLPQSIRKLLGILENFQKSSSKFQHQGKGHKRKKVRKPPESARKGSTRVVVPRTTVSWKRWEWRKAVCCARNMGACTRPTILVSAVSTREKVLLKRVSAERQPLEWNAMAMVRKTMPIPSRNSWNTSQNWKKLSRRPRKAHKRRNVARNTATLVILPQNRIMGMVELYDPVATKSLN